MCSNQSNTIETKYYLDCYIFFVYNDIKKERKMTLQVNIIVNFIRFFMINLYTYLGFMKITSNMKYCMKNLMIVLICNSILSMIIVYIDVHIDVFLARLLLIVAYGVILGIIHRIKMGYSFIASMISYAICMICYVISIIINFVPYKICSEVFHIDNDYLTLLLLLIVMFVLLYGFFKIKRFKNGFDFLKNKLNNDVTDIVIINISTIVILLYSLIGTIDDITRNVFIAFIILSITMIITIQKTLTMYYKQKLLKETMKDYERELAEKDKEIERLQAEKFNISKITHEFYNRQKALEMSVKDNLGSMETAEELGALDRIQDLTKEYSQKLKELKSLPELPLTEIPEIDDMFKYMQAECDKNNIEFRLKIVGDIFYLINHIIPKNKLETMIGDHIRDAIIAINSSKTTNKEIFVILGVKDKKYELCIYDTGIEFEIDTLLKLGLEQITTHKDTGGSGIGFLTTFETLNETKASLIIKELSSSEENHYTKAVIIRFDHKHQYKICSYRAKEIKEKNKDRKIIIETLR